MCDPLLWKAHKADTIKLFNRCQFKRSKDFREEKTWFCSGLAQQGQDKEKCSFCTCKAFFKIGIKEVFKAKDEPHNSQNN